MRQVAGLAAAFFLMPWTGHGSQELPIEAEVPEQFSLRVVTTGLQDPWEVLWGPDDHLWVTERSQKRILRIDPDTGDTAVAVEIPEAHRTDSQDGVLGLALRHGLIRRNTVAHAFVSFAYDDDPGPDVTRRLKVRRYSYARRSGTLEEPRDLLSGIPSGDDHVGGRLLIGPDQKLYLTVGDAAANHLWNKCSPNRAQDLPTAAHVSKGDWDAYLGKVLRIDLDGAIPADNPTIDGIRSHIFSYGHRNPQGLAFGPGGHLYASEHGPSTDDELNLIEAGKNYGWPIVAGYRDDRSYAYGNWSAAAPDACSSLRFHPIVNPPSVPVVKESAWNHPDFTAPLRTFFTVDDGYRFAELGNAVLALSGIDVYNVTRGGIPGWAGSLLLTSLRHGSVYRMNIGTDGTSIVGETFQYFRTSNRYRDLAISPDGRTIFVAVDSRGSRDHPGSILAFEYQEPLDGSR